MPSTTLTDIVAGVDAIVAALLPDVPDPSAPLANPDGVGPRMFNVEGHLIEIRVYAATTVDHPDAPPPDRRWHCDLKIRGPHIAFAAADVWLDYTADGKKTIWGVRTLLAAKGQALATVANQIAAATA